MHKIKKIVENKLQEIPVDVALKILQEAHQKNMQEAWAEIQAVLDKYKFRIEIRNNILLMPKVI
mgnify:CR=1 FL=1